MSDESQADAPSEFQLAVCQVAYQYMAAAGGDLSKLATYAKMQVVCGEALRSVVVRSQLLSKSPTMTDWSQADLLEVIATADKKDEEQGV